MTLFFSDLELKVQLYDYGDVGHFWVKGYEYLRNLEYQIAIISDKLEYLGEEYCSEGEKQLAALRDFPPLNHLCYPAAPSKYVVGKDRPWDLSPEAAETMKTIAKNCNDLHMKRAIALYQKLPARMTVKWIACLLHRRSHFEMVKKLSEWIRKEGARYPVRRYDAPTEEKRIALTRQAQRILSGYGFEYEDHGWMKPKKKKSCIFEARLFREEPFEAEDDGTELSMYIMLYEDQGGNINNTIIKVGEQ